MKKLYEQMLEIAVRNPQLLVRFPNDLIVHDRNQLEITATGQQWIWVLRESGTQIAIASSSIKEDVWQQMSKNEQDNTCNWGFPYIRETLRTNPEAKTFVLTVQDVDEQAQPLGTIKEVSHEEALKILACDRCLTYWQEKYPDHPMHLDLHRLKQPV